MLYGTANADFWLDVLHRLTIERLGIHSFLKKNMKKIWWFEKNCVPLHSHFRNEANGWFRSSTE